MRALSFTHPRRHVSGMKSSKQRVAGSNPAGRARSEGVWGCCSGGRGATRSMAAPMTQASLSKRRGHQLCSLDAWASGRARASVTPPLLCEITEDGADSRGSDDGVAVPGRRDRWRMAVALIRYAARCRAARMPRCLNRVQVFLSHSRPVLGVAVSSPGAGRARRGRLGAVRVADWAVALRSPEGALIAKVCPFDPASAAFVDLCRECVSAIDGCRGPSWQATWQAAVRWPSWNSSLQ